jgi:hypothetical protein
MSSSRKPRAFGWNDLLPALLALAALIVGIRIFAFFLFPYPMQVGYDEGYEAAGVERIIDGKGLPYVDAVSIRGPFLYWSLAIVHLIVGRFAWTGTRVIGLVCCAVVVISNFFTGWAAGWSLAGAIAGAIFVFVVATYYNPGGGIGVHSEPIGIAYISTAFFLAAFGLYRARSRRARFAALAGAGALCAIGALTKQTMGIALVPLLFWVTTRGAAQVAEAAPDGRARLRPLLTGWVLPFLAGGAGLVLLVILRYTLAGELKTYLYWSTGVATRIFMAPYEGRVGHMMMEWFMGEPWAILGVVLALTVALGPLVARVTGFSGRAIVTALSQSAFETTVGITAVLLLVAAALPLRIWPHYFLPVWGAFGMSVGVLLERVAVRGAPSPRLAQGVIILLVGALLIASATNRLDHLERERAGGSYKNPRPAAVCGEIDRIAGKGREEIFIWGVAGDLYVTCRRRCASMHTHTTLLLGIVPPLWNEPNKSWVPAGAQETLLAELQAKPPKVIIDHLVSVPGTKMADIPMYATLLRDRYCQVRTMDDNGRELTLYARKDLPACAGSH